MQSQLHFQLDTKTTLVPCEDNYLRTSLHTNVNTQTNQIAIARMLTIAFGAWNEIKMEHQPQQQQHQTKTAEWKNRLVEMHSQVKTTNWQHHLLDINHWYKFIIAVLLFDGFVWMLWHSYFRRGKQERGFLFVSTMCGAVALYNGIYITLT